VDGSATDREELRVASRAFIASAFEALRREHVIPTPIFHPYVAVGRDYYGDTISGLPEYGALECLLNEYCPTRFDEPLKRQHAEFASSYIYSFLEASVARSGGFRGRFDPRGQGVSESIDELVSVLDAPNAEVICVRHVSHLTTATGSEVEIGDITVVPETAEWGRLTRRIQEEVRGAARAWNRDDPRPYDPPHALAIAREMSSETNLYIVGTRLSNKVERFLLLARLLTAGTVQSAFEVMGTTTLVARMSPLMNTFQKGWMDTLVRRTVRLSGNEGPAFAALGDLLDAANIQRAGMAATSFDVALSKFNGSHTSGSPYEHLVDLATALEAALIGGERETEGLTLRLRHRVASLLSTDDDPAPALFGDVGHLYALRSKIVHGGQIKTTELRRMIDRVSTVPKDAPEYRFGIAVGYGVDRMRDIVRRAILARLCLGAGTDPPWPFEQAVGVDPILSDDNSRVVWRARWHQLLDDLGVGEAGDPPRSAVDFLSKEDR
jgi:hypothetical protein